MNTGWLDKEVRPTYEAGEALSWGDLCVLDGGKLKKYTAALDAAGTKALFFALDDADPADEAKKFVSVLVAGVSPSTILANASAAAFTQGAQVFADASNAGKVAATGTRVVGVYLDATTTLSAAGKLHVAPLYVPKAAGA